MNGLGRLGLATAWVGTLALLLGAGCSFDPKLPNGKIACVANSDCPPSQRCALTSAGPFCFDSAAALDAGLALPDANADLGATAGQGGTVAPGTGGVGGTGAGGQAQAVGGGGGTAPPVGGHGAVASGGTSPGVGGISGSGGAVITPGSGGVTSAGGMIGSGGTTSTGGKAGGGGTPGSGGMTTSAGGAGGACPQDPAICMHALGMFCQSSTQIVTCSRDGSGCLIATPTSTCLATKPCGGPVGSAMCACPTPPSECLTGATFMAGHVCASGMLETCGTDGNGCQAATGQTACPSPQTCGGSLPGASCQCAAAPTCTGNESGAHCGDAATLVTCTASGTCQQAASTVCASLVAEKCVGSFPSAKCEKAFGFVAADGGSANLTSGLLYGVSVQVTTAITLSRLGIVTTSAGAHVRLAIYAADGTGEPATWMASALPSSAVTMGRNELAINDPPSTTPVTLAVGKYWIFATADAATGLAQNGGTTPVRYASWSPFTKAFPTAASTVTFTKDNLAPADFYVVGVP